MKLAPPLLALRSDVVAAPQTRGADRTVPRTEGWRMLTSGRYRVADTIVIRDKTPRQAQPTTNSARALLGPLGPSANHVRAMKAMLVAMASDRVPADIRVDEVGRPMQLWAEAKFSLARRYEGRGLVGEKYLLQNVSPAPMVLAEQEFDREGGGVVGVAIENHNLRPGETTSVFVIRRGGER